MKFPLITCKKHGLGPGYCICIHIAAGAKPFRVIKATEEELGEAVCADCQGKELEVEDLVLWCAGCFAENVKP